VSDTDYGSMARVKSSSSGRLSREIRDEFVVYNHAVARYSADVDIV